MQKIKQTEIWKRAGLGPIHAKVLLSKHAVIQRCTVTHTHTCDLQPTAVVGAMPCSRTSGDAVKSWKTFATQRVFTEGL